MIHSAVFSLNRHQRKLITFIPMMTSWNGNAVRVVDPLWWKSTGHQSIPLTKASNAKHWCFLWYPPEQKFEQTVQFPVIWDVITVIVTSV